MTPDQRDQLMRHIHDDEVIAFLQELVRIPSPNPPGDSREVAEHCAGRLRREGIACELVAELPERPSVLASLGDSSRGPTLLLNAHIDTVPIENPESWRHDPFGGVIEDGLLYGRGAGDDKSSVAAQVMAAVALHRAGVRLAGRLLVNPVADEEAEGVHGARWLVESGRLRPDLVIIGEQTENRVAIAERAMKRFVLTVHGQAAHGAMPWNGVNAIVKMAKLIGFIDEIYPPVLADRTHAYLPHSTINLGIIQGGLKFGMVPELCKLSIDRRIVPGESGQSALEELQALCERFSREVEPLEYGLTPVPAGGSPVDTPPDHPLVQAIQSAVSEVSGEKRPLTGYQQASDGRYFASLGVPVVIFGPSHPDVGHTANEHVPTSQVVEAARVYALTALRVLAGA